MKAPSQFMLLLIGVLSTSSLQAATNLTDIVLAEASFQRDVAEVKRELPRALQSAVLGRGIAPPFHSSIIGPRQ
jgi:hypothetical protein